MQPYLFPYIGYYQLINAVDNFVIYDNVNYIKKGRINRNNILLNNKPHLITLSLSKVSQNQYINTVKILEDNKSAESILKTIYHAYNKAPYYNIIMPCLENIINNQELSLHKYLEHSLKEVCKYLGINTNFMLASSILPTSELKGQEKIIEICKKTNAKVYINPIGGQELYNKDEFEKNNLELFFIQKNDFTYKQFKGDFVPNLSIIDALMFCSKDEIKDMLENYRLI